MCEADFKEMEKSIREEYEKMYQEAISPETQAALVSQANERYVYQCATYVESGYDIANRRLMIAEHITEASVGAWMRVLQCMETLNDVDPIHIYVDSNGGSVYDGLALIDLIESLKSPVITYAIGKVCSMAFFVFLVGDKRVAFKRASFMHHQIYSTMEGNLTTTKKDVAETERLNVLGNKIISDRTKKKSKWWESQIEKTDFWFDAVMAKKLGVVEEII